EYGRGWNRRQALVIAPQTWSIVFRLMNLGRIKQRHVERIVAQGHVSHETPKIPEQRPVGSGSAPDIHLDCKSERFEVRCLILQCYGLMGSVSLEEFYQVKIGNVWNVDDEVSRAAEQFVRTVKEAFSLRLREMLVDL